jgi:predicted O-linked N-acetylglucosamine transferase (SPINDLY family)/predicted SAM-dependent methyltransferase
VAESLSRVNWLRKLFSGNADAAAEAPPAVAAHQGPAEARYSHALALMQREDYEAALAALARLCEQAPELPQAHFSYAYLQRQLGFIEESIASYRRALELRPEHADTRSHLLMALNYSSQHSPAEVFEEHLRCGDRLVQPVAPPAPDRAPGRRLRVGYLSPDFCSHVVSAFMLPVLARHDRERFEVYCYHSGARSDAVTQQMRSLAEHWTDCAGLGDAEIAARIRADRVDLLVDLAGHTEGQRMGVLALRPAPLQASWIGYPNTTGLRVVDYRITDARADPPGESEYLHVERLLRLPRSFLCYRPGPEIHPPTPLPAERAGRVTFGCFNNFQKLSGPFFDAAVKLLEAVPGSRLLLKAKPLQLASVQSRVRERFARAGIDASRIELRGWEATAESHLAAYDGVDVALDSFPYNGTTTTCEAMWMGVPVVTLRGQCHAGRVGASLLHSMGLDELVAPDAAAYVRIAAALAADRARLAQMRRGLRERLKQSALMDEPGFVRELEQAYEEIWRAKLAEAAARAAPAGGIEQAKAERDRGAPLEAKRICQAQLDLRPGDREALDLYCDLCYASGEQGAAIVRLGAALAAEPGVARSHFLLGCALEDLGRDSEAVAAYREALRLEPGLARAANNLGALLEVQGRLDDAATQYEAAAMSDPSLPQPLLNLGSLYKRRGNPADAVPWLEKAIALDARNPYLHCALGECHVLTWKLDEAAQCCRDALAIDPDHERAHFGLANALQALGRADEAERHFREALRLKPDFIEAHGNLLLCLHYRKGDQPEAIYAEHREWERRHARSVDPMPPRVLAAESGGRPLRIGYLSPNFHRHSVGFFLDSLLEAHDRRAVRIYGYSLVVNPDKITARLRSLCNEWRDVSASSDEQIARQVRADEIDILVDLAGHTGSSRLLVFARRPAPVQATWLGYPDTTGLAAMDWRLTDARADPPGDSDRLHSERLLRLERGFHCYAPPPESPEVVEPPSARTGHITFGSFNTLAKLTPEMVALWGRLLSRVPGSRMLIKAHALASAGAQRALVEGFAAQGVAAARLTLLGADNNLPRHLGRYGEIDIALDTFPYHGTTTTCEALWMGVPVITLAGRAHVSRVGVSLLHQVGLEELVAQDAEQYLDLAQALAQDSARLAQLRAGMRERMRASPLVDASGFARSLEKAYRDMWAAHLRSLSADPPAGSKPGTGPELRLHVGGRERKEGWKILNIQAGPGVDYVGDCADLSRFADGSVAEIYGSHVLEHLGYQEALPRALAEWHRVLRPGGRALISVPDFEVVCRLFADPRRSLEERIHLMRIAFGGQMDAWDFHYVGLSWEILADLLARAGFERAERMQDFGLFADTSTLRVLGEPISLNVIATKRA